MAPSTGLAIAGLSTVGLDTAVLATPGLASAVWVVAVITSLRPTTGAAWVVGATETRGPEDQ